MSMPNFANLARFVVSCCAVLLFENNVAQVRPTVHDYVSVSGRVISVPLPANNYLYTERSCSWIIEILMMIKEFLWITQR